MVLKILEMGLEKYLKNISNYFWESRLMCSFVSFTDIHQRTLSYSRHSGFYTCRLVLALTDFVINFFSEAADLNWKKFKKNAWLIIQYILLIDFAPVAFLVLNIYTSNKLW